jgi:SAM-dependent methyltransferase
LSIDYETYYQARPGVDSARASRWRELSATIKADHVTALLRQAGYERLNPVLEVGCGDGAVLAALHHPGARMIGAEISHSAAALARNRAEIAEVHTFDPGGRLPFPDRSFPLVVATHVLEHVHDPLALLHEMRRVSEMLVLLEVPLEHNAAARRSGAVARSVAAGHVQRFSRRSVRALLTEAGLAPRASLLDPLPRAVRVFQDGPLLGSAKWAIRSLLALPPGLAERVMTVHYAVLASSEHDNPSRQRGRGDRRDG